MEDRESVESGKLENLSIEEREVLRKELFNNLQDRFWCRVHGIDYVKPDIQKANEITYNELYKSSNLDYSDEK